MRRILLALIPGMAVAALAGQDLPQPAEVSYGYAGPLKASAWQVGTVCYVPITETRAWGWVVTLTRFDAKVEAEGRTVRVPYRIQAGKEVLPISQIVKQLGASFAWRKPGAFEVWSGLTKVGIDENGVTVEAPFPVKPYITHLQDPSRAVLDLHGAKLETFTDVKLPANARIGQFKPDVVRIVVETERRYVVADDLKLPGRGFDVKFAEVGAAADPNEAALAPPKDDPKTSPPILIEPPTTPPDSPPTLEPVFAGPLEVMEEGPSAAILRIPLGGPSTAPPKISRPEPTVLRVVLPGLKYRPLEGENPYEGAIKKVEVEVFPHADVIYIHLQRPMGNDVTFTDSEIRMMLIKPEVGDGKLAGKTVVVDAGHGGHDSGARSPDKKTQEKDLSLKIAAKVAEALAAQGATVIMTRKTDVFIPLQERSEIANRNSADFFISVHINSNRNANSTSGTITFHHKKDRVGILLAESIHAELAKVNKLPNIGVWSDQRIYSSGFAVLRYAKMPAVLLELGFINHKTDRARMSSAEFPEDVAGAVVRGLKVFLGDAKA